MRLTGLSLHAAHLHLPAHRETADPRTVSRDGYRALTVSADLPPPELAVRAATGALVAARWPASTLDLVAHAWIHHQGHDFWSPAHYLAHRLGAARALPVGVRQMCNGGVAALELAATRIMADPATERALVTTADRFAAPAFDRWRADYGVAYGDGATALLLARGDGPYRLLSVASTAAPELELMHRGDDSFGASPGAVIDVRRTKRAFLAAGHGPRFTRTANDAVCRVVRQALAEAGEPRVHAVALPRLGGAVLDDGYRPGLRAAGLRRAAVLRFGRGTGHLGAGDAAANLAEMAHLRLLRPGQVALVLSAGAGFTWSCLVVRCAY
ncbi:ketoacyl-ACP synthase III family protein [Actinoplanes sp. NEAU-A12]|uniref:Ketoacyl-ACP synthase III family protein n=1 Tax=Actinoplanes sandaracinus TaxID=3045177 RepID=A0ABT6WKZ6_9ACTN|nr:ketoacyl-ACP synthase III family protein [Actinoplanes sandaracinus]MDI6100399.1 ketoacyl-ACP synthase III family protein [Actinoplanes sandaracinus]